MSGNKLPIVERWEKRLENYRVSARNEAARARNGDDINRLWHGAQLALEQIIPEAATTITELVSALEGMLRIVLPVEMGLAQAECVDEPVPDDKTVLSFMGSGASDRVTAGEYRAAVSDARATLSTVRGETK